MTVSTAAAFAMLEMYEIRRPSFYARTGMELLERVITYELPNPRAFLATIARRRQEFVRLDQHSAMIGGQVLDVDHAAFPWFWWNSPEEFSSYLALPNTEAWAGMIDGKVVSYVGFTHYRRWSHLDRIAIHPAFQRHGYGREALHFSVERMVGHGAIQVALSTQGNNIASRRLYESVGFRPTPEHDYDVYGMIFPAGRRLMEESG